MTINRDAASGGVLVGLAVVYFLGARDLPPGGNEPGPAFFPLLLSGALLALGSVLVVAGSRGGTTPSPARPRPWRVAATMAFTMLYAAAFTTLGFFVSTWLYTLAITVTFGRGRPALTIAVPFASTLVIYLLFDAGLDARLPPGFLATP